MHLLHRRKLPDDEIPLYGYIGVYCEKNEDFGGPILIFEGLVVHVLPIDQDIHS